MRKSEGKGKENGASEEARVRGRREEVEWATTHPTKATRWHVKIACEG